MVCMILQYQYVVITLCFLVLILSVLQYVFIMQTGSMHIDCTDCASFKNVLCTSAVSASGSKDEYDVISGKQIFISDKWLTVFHT